MEIWNEAGTQLRVRLDMIGGTDCVSGVRVESYMRGAPIHEGASGMDDQARPGFVRDDELGRKL